MSLHAIQGPVHLMGVGGAGMSALAEAMARAGMSVSGCDLRESEALAHLRGLGVRTFVGHDPAHLEATPEPRTLVVTAAVSPDHPEILAARERGVEVVKRAQALGRWVAQGRVVGVAGTHGKTTTTAMVTAVLAGSGLDPTAFVGGRLPEWGGNLRPGRSDLFVVEADEFDRSFHALSPDVAVVTNMETDHLDTYGTPQGVREGFLGYLEGLRPNGRAVLCADDGGSASLLPRVGEAGYSYGLSAGSQLRGENPVESGGRVSCIVVEEGRVLGRLELGVPGLHNLRNALAAVAVARFLGVPWNPIRDALARFAGVGRRFDVLGEGRGVTVVDDYAHHPTEVAATLAGARGAYPDRRLVAVFQPHLFSRTRDFHREFGEALAAADRIWVTDVYPAREEPLEGVTGALVADAAREAGGDVAYEADLDALPGALEEDLRPGDLCVLMGAGSIEGVGPRLLDRLVNGQAMAAAGEGIHG